MKKGDIVKFKKVVDPGDEEVIMCLAEDPDGGRVLVETLDTGLPIPPTNRYNVEDLKECKFDRKAYLASCGTICPYCGNPDIEGVTIDIEDGVATQAMSCNVCYKRWTDVYRLVDVKEAN